MKKSRTPEAWEEAEAWVRVSAAVQRRKAEAEAALETTRYSPLATDLTAREVNAQRTEADRDFH